MNQSESAVEWTAAGQVVTYRSERDNRHCREGWAISDEHGRFIDTYWMSMSDAHVLTAAELTTAEHQFWIGDYRELDRHGRGTPDEWARYAQEDRRRVPSQHGLQARYFVRNGAEPSLETQVQNAADALRDAEQALRSAERRRDAAQDTLRELQARLDADQGETVPDVVHPSGMTVPTEQTVESDHAAAGRIAAVLVREGVRAPLATRLAYALLPTIRDLTRPPASSPEETTDV